jgi:hypothetical protein
MYGVPPEFSIGQTLSFQPPRPIMATSVRPMQGTGLTDLTNALELVPKQFLPLFVVPSSVVRIFSNTISSAGPRYSTTMNTIAQKNIILDDVFESYRLAQAKIAPYLK